MQVKSYKAGSVGQVEFDESVFGGKVLYRTLKDAVVMYQANKRQGTAATKGRSQVKGTNKKPYKQKHTGRARAGDVKSPIWRGGGTVFGPHPRNFTYHMPVKARRVALRGAMAGKLADGEVVIADLGSFTQPSSKAARKVLNDLGTPRRACVVVAERDDSLYRSFRNFPGVSVRTAAELCSLDVVAGGLIIAEAEAMAQISARVGVGAVGTAKSQVRTGKGVAPSSNSTDGGSQA